MTIFIASKPNFLRKRKSEDFDKNFWFFRKSPLQFSIVLEGPYKSREISDELYYLAEKLFKKKTKKLLS